MHLQRQQSRSTVAAGGVQGSPVVGITGTQRTDARALDAAECRVVLPHEAALPAPALLLAVSVKTCTAGARSGTG